jgi:hypothetical protein
MKTCFTLALIALLVPAGQKATPTERPLVSFMGVRAEYGGLDEVEVMLVNESDASIYLLGQDCGEAQVLRFNEVLVLAGEHYAANNQYESLAPLIPQVNAVLINLEPGDVIEIS